MSGVWSEEEISSLKSMWLEGLTASQIARILGTGRSRNAVLGKVHRMRLPERAQLLPVKRRAPVKRAAPRLVAQPAPAPETPSEDPGPMSPPIDTMSVRDHHCKWPYDVGATYHYCGQPPKPGHPWCIHHCKKAYQPKLAAKKAA